MDKANKLYNYPAIFYKEDNEQYSIIFPDIYGGTATYGKNLDDSFHMAIECLASSIHGIIIDGDTIPAATPIDKFTDEFISKVLDEPDYDKSRVFVNIISVNVAEYAEKHFNKAVKKMVTIPQWMDDMAKIRKLKLSKVLQDALKEKLQTI